MNATVIFAVLFVVLGTIVVFSRRRERVERTYYAIEYFRGVIGAIAIITVSWTFLRSGSTYLIAIALGLIMFATVYVLVEQPHKTLV